MFYTIVWGVEHNYGLAESVEGNLRSLNVISRSFPRWPPIIIIVIIHFVNDSSVYVWHMFYTIFWGVEYFYGIAESIECHLRSLNGISKSFPRWPPILIMLIIHF